MSANATNYVIEQEDIVWHKVKFPGVSEFWLSDNVIGADYTSAFNAQLCKIGPGGGSEPHQHTYNHAFYFIGGTSSVQISDQKWDTKPGTVITIPADKEHSLANTGTEDLIFIVVYDPPIGDAGAP